MNTYKPVRLVTITKDGTYTQVVLRDYSLYHIDISKMKLNSDYAYIAIEDVIDLEFYDGFYFEGTADGKWMAHDFRVNEGMLFSAATKEELKLIIESHLHTLALEEEQNRIRQAKLKEKTK